MAGAPKPKSRMITTKTGRMINPSFAKKVQGKNTKIAIKENLKKMNKANFNSLLEVAKKENLDSRRLLLSKGIDARQFKAKGYSIREANKVFPLQEIARTYGIKEIAREFGGLQGVVNNYSKQVTAQSFGGLKEIVRIFGLEESFSAYGFKTISDAYGGRQKLFRTFGTEEVIRASQAGIAGVKNYDALKDIREFSKDNGVVETARNFGIGATGRALGLSAGDMKELARRLKKK